MTLFRDIGRLAPYGMLAGGALALTACNDGGLSQRSLQPIPPETLALMEQAGVTKESPTLIRAYKKEAEFQIWKQRPDGRYVYLKTFPMCRWSGQLGPKVREGDRQVPEGFYSITPGQMNPNSAYYLSFNVGYPNALDRALGHSGGSIMVHGACSSAGCFSMTDYQIAEIYAIARTSFNNGQRAIQMQSYPFKMTAENLAKHRLDPNIGFWKQLKTGSDHFETAWREPTVGACGRRYVFNASPAVGHSFDAGAPCPPLRQDPQMESLVAEKAAKDEAKIAELAAAGVKPVRVVYQDGGQHPDFTARVAEVSRPEALVAPPVEIVLEEKAAKPAVKVATKSPVVTLAAAKARAKAEAEIAVAAVAPTAEPVSEPARLAALAAGAGAGAIGGLLGLRKEEPASVAATDTDAAKTETIPAKAIAPSPPHRVGEAAAKKPQPQPQQKEQPQASTLRKEQPPQASTLRKEPQAALRKEPVLPQPALRKEPQANLQKPQANLQKEPHARAAMSHSTIATASLRAATAPLPQPLRP
jgi:murein L,D-transpeptidase YafK